MRPEPLASVIVPTIGRAQTLRRALSSLIAQDTPEWEALVVDDRDGAGIDVARAIGDERIRPLANAGSGIADARNTALSLARGQLVCWLDDDDWWDDPGHLSRLVAVVDDDRFLYRGGYLVHESVDGSEIRREVFDHVATAETLQQNNTILTSSLAYPRGLHRRLGLLDRELGGYCDWDFMLRMCRDGRAPLKVEGLGVCYSIHPAGTSSAFDSPDRTRYFERFRAKHGLEIRIANHLRIHRMLTDGT
jgi:glycosyltransferase involved in cell wall biosynthesis